MIAFNDEEAMNVLMGSSEINKAIICEDQVFEITLSDFIDEAENVLLFHTSGWESVKEKVAEVSTDKKFRNKKVVGLIDRDYLDARDPNVFLGSSEYITTHLHDCEIDLIHSSAFDVFIKAKAQQKHKDSAEEIKSKIAERIRIIGCVRKYSHAYQKSWTIPAPGMKFNEKAWITTLKMENKISAPEWESFEAWLLTEKNDAKEVIHGHDFVSQLLEYLMRKTSRQEFSNQCFETSENLALSFDSKFKDEIPWVKKIWHSRIFCG